MTLSPALQAMFYAPPTIDSIWHARIPSPSTFNEGATVTFSIQCFNAIPGVSKMIWKLAGSRAGSGWSKPWPEAWNAVMKARGMKYTQISASANGATVAGLIEVLPGYDGKPIEMSITCLENRRTDTNSTDPLQITLQLAFPSGSSGVLRGSGSPFFVRDTSKTPEGYPTYRLQAFAPDGFSSPGSLGEGDSFILQLTTENMVPGTVVLVYAANVGQSHLVGGFRPAIKAAAEAAGCTCATDYATRGNYNGGVITYGPDYVDSAPIRIPLTLTEDETTTGDFPINFITTFREHGNEDTPTLIYGGVVTLVIRDTSRTRSPSYWRANAKRVGGNLIYSIKSPTGASDASVTITSVGTKPAGFDAALAAAVAADPNLSLSGNVLSSLTAWDGDLTWSVANPGGAGKHGFKLSGATADSIIMVGDASVFFSDPAIPAAPTYVTGVNISGGEFGTNMPGVYGTDYRYPSRPELADPAGHSGLTYHTGKGAGIIRLPIRWERIQEEPYGPLVSAGTLATWSGRLDMDRIDEIIEYVTGTLGKLLLLDVHNYMGYAGRGKVGYDQAIKVEELIDLWEKLANRYASNPKVWFGLMNEPSGGIVTTERTRDIMEWVMNAVRLRTPALNRVMVSGTFYTGAWSWVGQGNAAAMEGIADPAGNFVFEMHQYFDSDSSGTKGLCISSAQTRLNAATNWARALGYKIFLGEFMGGNPTVSGQENCGAVVPAACTFMAANQDVWCGWTAWGGGDRWGQSYIFRLDPIGGVDTPQFDMIEPYLVA